MENMEVGENTIESSNRSQNSENSYGHQTTLIVLVAVTCILVVSLVISIAVISTEMNQLRGEIQSLSIVVGFANNKTDKLKEEITSLKNNFENLQNEVKVITDKIGHVIPSTLPPMKQPGHSGTDFLLTFPQNYWQFSVSLFRLYIYLTTNSDTVVSVQVQNNTGHKTYLFNKYLTVEVDRAMQLEPNIMESKAIRVTANDTISVSGYNTYSGELSDAYNVAPVEHLGTSYIVVSYHPYSGSQSFVSISPVQSNTTVTVKINTTGSIIHNGQSYDSGDDFDLYMTKYNTFQISNSMDLTGTKLYSDKPVIVQSGCTVASPPSFDTNYYSVFLPPISSLGSTFIIPKVMFSNKTSVRVVPLDNTTSMTLINQHVSRNYHLYQTLEIDIDIVVPSVITCSKPCLVAAYSYSYNPLCNFMTLIPAISQFSYNYTYITPYDPFANIYTHYLAVAVKSSDAGGLMINDKHIFEYALTSHAVMINQSSWSVLTVEVTNGTYSIATSINGSQYGVIAYGLRYSSAYGFPLGLTGN